MGPGYSYELKEGEQLKPIRDHIIVAEMAFGEAKTRGGIVLPSDDGKESGVKPRWAKVVRVGPEQKNVKVGEWVLVEHGRWTRGVKEGSSIIRMVEEKAILLVSDEEPEEVKIYKKD